MKETRTSKQYDLWAWCYDRTFGVLVRKRQRRAIAQLQPKPGDRVLDVGVGTGIALNFYPKDVSVVGMDLSKGMLTKAQRKVAEHGLTHCNLVQGDAMLPPFAENSFDHIVITHTISVVSEPAKLLQWAQRVVRPGGRIVVLNHFQSTKPTIAFMEKVMNPLFVWIGWRSDLTLEECMRGVELNLDYCFKVSLFDVWRIVVFSKPPAGQAARPAVPVPVLSQPSEPAPMPSGNPSIALPQ